VVERVDDIDQLWAHFTADPSPELRDKLIVHYAPLVKYVAGRVGVGLPRNVEQADLASYGTFGLIDAIEKFDPERGTRSRRTRSPASRARSSMSSARSTGSLVRSAPRPATSSRPSPRSSPRIVVLRPTQRSLKHWA
jgi:hypothetical protein